MKSQLEIAIDLALLWHGEQRYGKMPYFIHLRHVDEWVVARNGYEHNETLRPIAYLHDILEDTDIHRYAAGQWRVRGGCGSCVLPDQVE